MTIEQIVEEALVQAAPRRLSAFRRDTKILIVGGTKEWADKLEKVYNDFFLREVYNSQVPVELEIGPCLSMLDPKDLAQRKLLLLARLLGAMRNVKNVRSLEVLEDCLIKSSRELASTVPTVTSQTSVNTDHPTTTSISSTKTDQADESRRTNS